MKAVEEKTLDSATLEQADSSNAMRVSASTDSSSKKPSLMESFDSEGQSPEALTSEDRLKDILDRMNRGGKGTDVIQYWMELSEEVG